VHPLILLDPSHGKVGMSASVSFDVIAVDWAGTLTGARHRPTAQVVQRVLKSRFGRDASQEFFAAYERLFWTYYEQSLPDSLANLLAAAARESATRLPAMDLLTQAIWQACPDHDLDTAAADALRELHQRHQVPVWLATNTCRPAAHRHQSLLQAGLSFVQPLCSSDIGVAKPDPRYYRELIRRSRVPAPLVLFIGDHLPPDVLGPAQAGMHTVWINGATSHEAAEHTVPPETITVPHLSHLPAALLGGNR
jgi:HAD superfamily hydrolase (TIGR01549 family)